jgi:hypothetical protein
MVMYSPKYGILMSREKNEVADKIKTWLREEGYQTNEIQDPNADFHFQIQNPNVSIIINRDCITMATFVAFPELDQRLLTFMSQEGKKFFWQLRERLNTIGVAYRIHPSIEKVERIDITTNLYSDGLIKNTLFNSLFDISRGIECVNLQYEWLSAQGFK